MNIHEYQAKELLKRYGVAVLDGYVAWTPDEAAAAAEKLPVRCGWSSRRSTLVAAAQAASPTIRKAKAACGSRAHGDEVRAAADAMIGHTLVTKQTGPAGRPVRRVYVEAGCDIARELYLSLLIDRVSGRMTIIASTEGGIEIEEVAASDPEKILRDRHRPGIRHLRLSRSPAGGGTGARRQAGRGTR